MYFQYRHLVHVTFSLVVISDPKMFLRLIDMSSDVNRDVQDQIRICFNELCGVIDNVDSIKIIPDVINGYMEL